MYTGRVPGRTTARPTSPRGEEAPAGQESAPNQEEKEKEGKQKKKKKTKEEKKQETEEKAKKAAEAADAIKGRIFSGPNPEGAQSVNVKTRIRQIAKSGKGNEQRRSLQKRRPPTIRCAGRGRQGGLRRQKQSQ